jgi:hypothetical protein
MKSTSVTKELLADAYSYHEYNDHIEQLYEDGRSTNDDNSETMLNYTKLNISRFRRWDERASLLPEVASEISALKTPMVWMVLSEGWCGDSAQILPFVNKMAEVNDHIDMKVIFRDQYPEVMDEFLTNGTSRSIPKIVFLHAETLEVLGSWGPRPKLVHERYMAERADPEIGGKKAANNLHVWYARDKGKVIQQEFLETLKSAMRP